MRLLTIHQPWAWLIVAGFKRFENRGWHTNYRGPVLIHAGKSNESLTAGKRLAESLDIRLPPKLTFGAVIGTVDLVNCTTATEIDDPFATGPFCFHLANPVLFADPIEWRGALGLVEPSVEMVEAINRRDVAASIAGPQ